MKWVVLACRVALGALFVYAAITKLPDMNAFAGDVANYRVLPAALVPYSAAIVVGLEVVLGLALLSGFAARPAAAVAGTLIAAFIVFIAQALLRHIDLRCGCFGGDELATWWTVARDVVLLVPAALVVRKPA